MQAPWYLALIPGLPLASACVIALMRNRWPKPRIALTASLSVLAAFVATLVALVRLLQLPGDGYRALELTLWQWGIAGTRSISLGLLGDSLSLWFALVVTGVGFLIHVYSAAYMEEDPSFGRYFAELNYFIFAMSLLVLSDNFLGTLLGWAQVGLASYLLIGFWHQTPAAQAAANKAFIMNVGGEVGLILGLALIYGTFGSFRFAEVFPQVASAPVEVLTAIGLLLLVGAAAKSAQLPLHTWLPDAMQGPTPVSALIHAATMVTAGVYLIARAFPIFQGSPVASHAVALVGAASALYGGLAALGQTDIKRVLAYSTMSQVGYMVLSAGVGAYEAALFHFFTHAFFKALLFLAAGMVIHHLGGEQDILRMGGLGRRMPFPYWTFLIGALALAGAPPLAGFFSKDEILVDLLLAGERGYWTLGLLVAGLTAFYMFRLFCLVFTGPHWEQARAANRKEARTKAPLSPETAIPFEAPEGAEEDQRMAGPVAILTVLSIAAGWLAVPGGTNVPARFLGSVFRHYPGVAPAIHHAAVDPAYAKSATLTWALVLAIAGAGIAMFLYGPRRAPGAGRPVGVLALFQEGFYVDRLYRGTVVPLAHGLASLAARFLEPSVIDGAIHGLVSLVQAAAEGTRELHRGYVRRYALTFVAGTVLTLIYFALL